MSNLIKTHSSRALARQHAKTSDSRVVDLNSAAAKKEFSIAALSDATRQAVRWITVPKEAVQRPKKRVTMQLLKYSQTTGYRADAPKVVCTTI